MSELEVPGAHLYYEIRGDGPLLVMIPGAGGSADPFQAVAAQLAARYAVLTYDRRGFSRSQLDGPQDYERRLETDADDVRRLIEHVSNAPAAVFGVSSGAIVGLEVLTSHASVVRVLVPYEAPLVKLLRDGQTWVDFFNAIYDQYRQAGIGPAMNTFRQRAFAAIDREAMARAAVSHYAEANAAYWFEHELRQYPALRLDFGSLRPYADRILPAGGRESRGFPAYDATAELARKLGRELAELPGGHLGCVSHPREFAAALVQALTRGER